jgi:hypothetical protein
MRFFANFQTLIDSLKPYGLEGDNKPQSPISISPTYQNLEEVDLHILDTYV